MPVFDERFGSVVRNASRGFLDFRTHRQIMFSDCAVYAANKWMEYGAGATLKAGRSTYALGMIGLIAPNAKADIAAAETHMVLVQHLARHLGIAGRNGEAQILFAVAAC